MAIFDLDEKDEQTIARHAHDEVSARSLKFTGVRAAVLVQKVLIQVDVRLATDGITRIRVGHALDHATARVRGDDPVRKQEELQALFLEYIFHDLHDLKGQHVLAYVVAHFKRKMRNKLNRSPK